MLIAVQRRLLFLIIEDTDRADRSINICPVWTTPLLAISHSELVPDAELERTWHDKAAIRRQNSARVALGRRILVGDVVGRQLDNERLTDPDNDEEIEFLITVEQVLSS